MPDVEKISQHQETEHRGVRREELLLRRVGGDKVEPRNRYGQRRRYHRSRSHVRLEKASEGGKPRRLMRLRSGSNRAYGTGISHCTLSFWNADMVLGSVFCRVLPTR